MLYILSDYTIVVNYDADNGWTTLLDKFKETPVITKEVESALDKLKTKNLLGITTAKQLGEAVGYTDEQFFKFAKQADLSGDLLQQYKDYISSASTATSKFGAALKSAAANIGIMLAINAGIQLLAWGYDQVVHRQENLNKAASESAKKYQELQSEVESLNDKLETTVSRMQELEDKPHLTFVEQDELKRLRDTNAELERTLKLKQADENIAGKKARKEALKALENTSSYKSYQGWQDINATDYQYEAQKMYLTESSGWGTTLENAQKQLADYDRYVSQKEALDKKLYDMQLANPETYMDSEYQVLKTSSDALGSWISDLESKLTSESATLDEFKNSLDPTQDADLINSIGEFQDLYINKFTSTVQTASKAFDDIWNADTFSNARKELESMAQAGTLSSATLANNETYNQLLKETGKTAEETCENIYALVEAEKSVGNIVKSSSFTDIFSSLPTDKLEEYIALVKDGVIDEKTIENYEELSKAMSQTGTSAEEAIKAIKAYVKGFTSSTELTQHIQESYDLLTKIQKEVDKTKQISLDSLNSIAKQYPELTTATAEYAQGLISTSDLMALLEQAYNNDANAFRTAMAAKLDGNEVFFNTIKLNNEGLFTALAKAYGVDVGNWKTMAQAKAEIDQALIQKLGAAWGQYYGVVIDQATGLASLINKTPTTGLTTEQSVDLIVARTNAESMVSSFNHAKEAMDKAAQIEIGLPDFGGIGGKSASGGSKGSKDTSEEINYIDRLLSQSEKRIQQYKNELEDAFTLKDKYTALDKIVTETESQLKTMDDVYKFYSDKASEKLAQIPEGLRDSVRNGTIDIETLNDEKLANLIKEFWDLDGKSDDAKDKIRDLDTSIKDLAKQRVQIKIDILENKQDRLNFKLDKYKALISAVVSGIEGEIEDVNDYYDRKIDKIQSQIDALETQKKVYQDQLDALNEQNEALEIQKKLEDALYEKRKAENNKNVHIYREDKGDGKSGFVWESDQDAVKDANEQYDEAVFDKKKYDLQTQIDAFDKQISALDETIDKLEKSRDNELDYLNSIKDSWSSIEETAERIASMEMADGFWGDGWFSDIMNGDTSYLDDMTEKFQTTYGIISDNQQEIDRLNELLSTIDGVDNATAMHLANMATGFNTLGTTATTQSGNVNTATTSIPPLTEENRALNEESLLLWGENFTTFGGQACGVADSIAASYESMAARLEAAAERAVAAIKRIKRAERDDDDDDGYAKGTRNAKPGLHPVAEGNKPEIIIKNSGNAVVADRETYYPFSGGETVLKSEDTKGILNGDNTSPIRLFNGIDMDYLNSFDPDEMTAKYLPNFNMPMFDTSKMIVNNTENKGPSLTIGKIEMHEVNDAEGLTKEICSTYSSRMSQMFYKR